MDPRPRLRPGQRPLRRSADSLQLGLTGDAVVLCGLSAAELALVESLDGRYTLAEVYAVGVRRGVPRPRVDALLGVLHAEGLLASGEPDPRERERSGGRAPLPAPSVLAARRRTGEAPALPASRADRYVLVGGAGPVPEGLAATLRDAGVGRVDLGSWALDYVELELRDRPDLSEVPDLVVLAAQDALDPCSARPWRRHGVPVLALVADPGTVVVGPLVADAAAPCLTCLQLHRSDRDPHWPRVLAQACAEGSVPRPVRAETTLAATAAGVGAMVCVAQLDGQGFPAGLTLELRTPLPRMDHRPWPRHPHCTEHERRATERRVTMTG